MAKLRNWWSSTCILIFLTAVVAFAGVAHAQDGLVKVIYPFAAGGSGDAMARILAERLAAILGTTAIVENRTGAAGRIGIKSVIASPPDGRTLLFVSNPPMVIYPHSYAVLDFDPVKDLVPISLVASFDVALVVSPKIPVKTLPELIAWLKTNPEQAAYGSPGAGGLGHFMAAMFAATAKLDLRHVSYRGSAAVLNDLVAGHVPLAAVPLSDVAELHKGGNVRILATGGDKRTSALPDIPTFREAGFDMAGFGWYALYAPAKTPPDVIARIGAAVGVAMASPEVKARVLGLVLEPHTSTSAELAQLQAADRERWGPVVKASGFRQEN